MTYPFAGEIKMTKVVKDGQEVIEWEPVNMTYHADGNVGIPQWDGSAPLVMGEHVERMRISMEGVGIIPGNGGEFVFRQSATEWARVDKDLNVTHLDMDLCRNGEQNEYTALAIAIWNAAKNDWQGLTKHEVDEWKLPYRPTVFEFAKFIEAKIKEKNGYAERKNP
jgi:hypothetical protein